MVVIESNLIAAVSDLYVICLNTNTFKLNSKRLNKFLQKNGLEGVIIFDIKRIFHHWSYVPNLKRI